MNETELRMEVDRLRAENSKLNRGIEARSVRHREVCDSLAAANALLARWQIAEGALDSAAYVTLRTDTRVHLAAQPATAPTRTEAEQRVLDAFAEFKTKWMREQIEDAIGTRFGLNKRIAAMVKIFRAELARRGESE